MSKWLLKAVVQKVISYLPNSNRINYWFQKNITKGVDLNEQHFAFKFEHLVDHVNFFLEHRSKNDLGGETCLELGTGWYPIIPIGLFLKGADKTLSVDISPLLTTERFLTCIREILKREALFLESLGQDIRERLQVLRKIQEEYDESADLQELCRLVNLEIMVADARKLDLPDAYASLITSNNTFEHVYPEILEGILNEFWRLLKPGGMMSHFIDMSDHFAHMDSSITIYNFLRFSRKSWSLIDNTIQPQNRWRLLDYKALYDRLDIPYVEKKIRPGDEELVKSINVHPELQSIPVKELAISHAYLLSMKP